MGGGPLEQRILAYVDDIALVLVRWVAGFRRLLPVLAACGRVRGLCLRADKSMVVPLGGRPEEVHADLATVTAEAAAVEIRGAARYLGVVLGPCAEEMQWEEVMSRWCPRGEGYDPSGVRLATPPPPVPHTHT